ncbi:unnamed protein product, partial [Staurois parvus]
KTIQFINTNHTKHKRSAILNIIQCKQTKPPTDNEVHTSKRRQAGRSILNWAGRYRGEQAENGRGVTGQVQQVASTRSTEGQAEGWSGSQARDQKR